ncbi:MAG: hypothetical protein AAGF71_09060 [Pseudomonadota bacterium]
MTTSTTGSAITRDEHWRIKAYLECLAARVMDRDFDGYANMIALPIVVVTRNMRVVRTTREELRIGFDIWMRTLDTHGATALVHRLCDAERVSGGRYMVDYDTDLLRGDQWALPTFKNLLMLREEGGGLRMEQMVSGVSNEEGQRLLRVEPGNTDPLFGTMHHGQDNDPRHA